MKGAIGGGVAKNKGSEVKSVRVFKLTKTTESEGGGENVVFAFVAVEEVCGRDAFGGRGGVTKLDVPKISAFLINF